MLCAVCNRRNMIMDNVLIWGIRIYICLLLLHGGSGYYYSEDIEFVKVLQSVKAWRGSCVLLPCTITYQGAVNNYTWYHNPVYDDQVKDFIGKIAYNSLNNTELDSLFENNVEYKGMKEKDCTILIKNLKNEHSGQYRLRLVKSGNPGFKWMSKTYVNVTVSDAGPSIEIEPVPEIEEFQVVTLTCSIKYYCPLHNIKLSWIEDVNGTAKTETRSDTGDVSTKTSLTFRPSWADHKKNFTCVLQQEDQEKNESQSVQLNVKYAPKNVKIWSNNTTTFMERESITLECSVETSNPPVDSFVWYKNGKEMYRSTNTITVREAGKYYCEADNTIAKTQSNVVEISVLYAPKKTLINTKGSVVEGKAVTLTCSTTANPPVSLYTWCKNGKQCFNSTNIYKINAITTYDSGSYTCAAHNKLGSDVSDPLKVDVKYPPKDVKIVLEPASQTFREGTKVKFACVVGSSNPSVTSIVWLKNDKQDYTIRGEISIRAEDSGMYTCQAGNNIGQSSSQPVSVEVQHAPKKPIINTEGSVVEGKTVTLNCSTTANPPVSLYIWYKNGMQCFNSTNSIYKINAITTYDSGSYTCDAHNTLGSDSSDPRKVDVKYPPKDVKIVLEPASQTFREGTKVKFACVVGSSNPSVTSIVWFKDKERLQTFREEISIRAEDSGMYTCQARNDIDQSTSQPISVEVHYPPKAAKITIEKESVTKEGDQITLKCSVQHGNPKTSHFEWLKDGKVYKSTGDSDILLINTTWKDSGYYSCRASNNIGNSTSKSAFLNVQYAPRNVTLSITPGNHVTEYTDVMLRCTAQSNPQERHYLLYKDNQFIIINEYMALDNIQRSNAGEYRCSARNAVGEQRSEVVNLYVSYSWYSIGIYISSVLGSLILIIIFLIIVQFRVWKKNGRKTTDDSSFFVLKKQSHNENHEGQDTPSANSSTDHLNYSTLQFPAGDNGQIDQPRVERKHEDPSAIYSIVKKPLITAEYENIESSKKVHDEDEIHYSVIANLPKEGTQVKQDPEVEYAMLRH
ncbi:B-cell receptor CD22 isoform X4 [Pseudophryne corroboree]|uniref:B-cell receptor CD22 isoform X4 n=1 Tax=Pseudophryne corroboree TaxID=495146 RepID=UPI003081E4F7